MFVLGVLTALIIASIFLPNTPFPEPDLVGILFGFTSCLCLNTQRHVVKIPEMDIYIPLP